MTIAEFDLISFKQTTVTNVTSHFGHETPLHGIEVVIALARKPSYYSVTFVAPSLLITAIALFGEML